MEDCLLERSELVSCNTNSTYRDPRDISSTQKLTDLSSSKKGGGIDKISLELQLVELRLQPQSTRLFRIVRERDVGIVNNPVIENIL